MKRFLSVSAVLAAVLNAQEPAAAPDAAKPQAATYDFNALTPGDLPEEGFMSTDAEMTWKIVEENGNKFAELQPQPIQDAGLLIGPSVKGAATVRAKFLAGSKRRVHPRFGVGLHGTGGFRVRVVPALKVLEIAQNDGQTDNQLASAPLDWKPDTWVWVEIAVLKNDKGGSTIEARSWADGTPRPDQPMATHSAEAPPGSGKASVWGTPYSEKPIRVDDVTVTPAP